jgi:two-component system copper resistance phosphate regulon response regulator CusR
MQVCLVEDDARIAELLQQALEEEGSVVVHLASGENAASYIASQSFDVVVLDLMLPVISGLTVLQHLRQGRCQTPVLILSASDTVPEMIRALDIGADDYMTKPFHLELFLARVRSVSRRGAIPQSIALTIGPVMLQPSQRRARLHGERLELTRREYMMLETLMRRVGRVVTRDQLTAAVWGITAEVSKNNLDYYVHSLRAKLGPACEGMIQTVRGIGYILQHGMDAT